MNIWLENSKKNILPRSVEQTDFKEALKEWSFTGNIIDHEEPIEICELCEKDDLRYEFEISNALGNTLWVGSKCIDKFDITVIDEFGDEVTGNKNTYLLKQAKKQHVKNVFENLRESRPGGKLQGFNKIELDKYCIDKYFLEDKLDPKMLNYLFIRLDEESISYDKKFFSISLRSDENKEKLLALIPTQFERIKKALTVQQRKFYTENS